MAGNAPEESTSKSTDFSKNPKIKSKYGSKKAKSRRKQRKFTREAKRRTGKDHHISIEKESLLEQFRGVSAYRHLEKNLEVSRSFGEELPFPRKEKQMLYRKKSLLNLKAFS